MTHPTLALPRERKGRLIGAVARSGRASMLVLGRALLLEERAVVGCARTGEAWAGERGEGSCRCRHDR
jgi:hypothetical protein